MMLASFLAGAAFLCYAGSLKCLTKLSLHPMISEIYFYWCITMFLCTRRLFKQFSLGRKPSMHECHWAFKPQTLPKTPIQFGNPQYLACTIEAAVSAWQWIWCKQQECTSKRWRCHWAAAPGFFLGMAAAPHFLQRIWNCSAKLDLALTYLEMQNRLKQIRLGEWGCKAGAWEGKRLTAVQACSVFGQLQ